MREIATCPFEDVGPKEDPQRRLTLMFDVASFGRTNNHLEAGTIALNLAKESGYAIPTPQAIPRQRTPQS